MSLIKSVSLFLDGHCPIRLAVERRKGKLQAVQNCPLGGYLTAFQLRVNPNGNYTDDTPVNNIRFQCSTGRGKRDDL